jgi:hypothetical protein
MMARRTGGEQQASRQLVMQFGVEVRKPQATSGAGNGSSRGCG